MDCSTPGFPVLHYLLEFAQTHVHWAGDNTQSLSSLTPFSSCPQIFPTSESFPVSWLLASGGKIIGASASVLPMNIQSWFFFLWLFSLISCCPRDSQGFSPVPQLKIINFSALSLLYGPTLTSVHDYWKNHRFDSMDLCWSSDVSAFEYTVQVCHSFFFFFLRSTSPLILWLQSPSIELLEPKKVNSAWLLSFPIYLLWSDGTGCHDFRFLNAEF